MPTSKSIGPHPMLPLSTLLSFAWTAFTIEVDNLFEARMRHRTTLSGGGKGPWLVSHAMWWTCMRFVDSDGVRLSDLEALTRTPTNLHGMIRWGYVTIEAAGGGGILGAETRSCAPPRLVRRRAGSGRLWRERWKTTGAAGWARRS